MHLIFYKSALCPRCFLAKRHLLTLRSTHPDLRIEEVEILTAPLRAWRDGIKMVPALKAGNAVLSGLYLNKQEITDFVTRISTTDK